MLEICKLILKKLGNPSLPAKSSVFSHSESSLPRLCGYRWLTQRRWAAELVSVPCVVHLMAVTTARGSQSPSLWTHVPCIDTGLPIYRFFSFWNFNLYTLEIKGKEIHTVITWQNSKPKKKTTTKQQPVWLLGKKCVIPVPSAGVWRRPLCLACSKDSPACTWGWLRFWAWEERKGSQTLLCWADWLFEELLKPYFSDLC